MSSFMSSCALPELPFPMLAYLYFYFYWLTWVRNVICATVGKWVGCSFNYGVYRRVFKIRPAGLCCVIPM